MSENFKPPVWLVEVELKVWVADKPNLPNGRTVHYVEVEATTEYAARVYGFEEFEKQLKNDPILKRKWESLHITLQDICTPSAICIEE
jgi:hypothetical protein